MTSIEQKLNLQGKSILVVGLGMTGLSVLEFLGRNGIGFDVADSKLAEQDFVNQLQATLPANSQLLSEFTAEKFSGYDVLICSPGVPLALPAIQAAINAGAEVIGDIEIFARLCDVPVIAVTGSNGKSTVVAWLDAILKQSPIKAVACGNIGEPVLGVFDDDAELYVLELSSFQLETLHSLAPISATVLNISEDHLDRYDDLQHYARTKRHIYSDCKLAVMNADDSQTWTDQTADSVCFSSDVSSLSDRRGSGGPASRTSDVQEIQCRREASYTVAVKEGVEWLLADGIFIVPVSSLALPGIHNVNNALAALALLAPLNLPVDVLSNGLAGFKGLRHRTQLVAENGGIRWYNDSKGTNVDACSKAVSAMSAPVLLIAGGLGKGADFSLLRPAVEQHVKHLILMGRDGSLLEEALKGSTEIHFAADMHDAVRTAATLAETGDVVLLSPACASFDMFKSFEHRGDEFIREVEGLAA